MKDNNVGLTRYIQLQMRTYLKGKDKEKQGKAGWSMRRVPINRRTDEQQIKRGVLFFQKAFKRMKVRLD